MYIYLDIYPLKYWLKSMNTRKFGDKTFWKIQASMSYWLNMVLFMQERYTLGWNWIEAVTFYVLDMTGSIQFIKCVSFSI